MRISSKQTLEFNIVLEQLSAFALSQQAKEKLQNLGPSLKKNECKQRMRETTEAVKIMECFGNPPLAAMFELDKILELTVKGSMLNPEQLTTIAGFITSCKRMKSYLKKAEIYDFEVAFYGGSLSDFSVLYEEIDRTIRNGQVDDNASSCLRDIRRKIENARTAVRTKLESMLRSKKEWFADGYVVNRNGRLVLPVKKEYKSQVAGTVVDSSGTGNTFFIEPAAVAKLQEELSLLIIEEENEVRKILYTLTALVDDHANELKLNMDCIVTLDYIFAKAKLSVSMKAIPVSLTTERKITVKQGRHPLLKQEACIPLDFEIGGEVQGVVITGPNTGGKTVALKTVGLLSLMAQSGLHVPVAEGSLFCMHANVLCDIGDGQSITENLSTFSSHITNIISILNSVSNESLVLLDELGSGTDPAEGMGLAVSIIEELRKRDCLFVVTTHYPEIKDFANHTQGLINARMEFDRESLRPLYKLKIGEAGESCALYIAQRLGLPEHMLKRAHEEAYGRNEAVQRNIPAMKFTGVDSAAKSRPADRIQKETIKSTVQPRSERFNIGDSVLVFPQKLIGIIFRKANEKGELGVQIKGDKQFINHKRIKLLTPASELYPDNYDFSIIFDSVENRKARHQLNKGHRPGVEIKYDVSDL